MLSHSLVFYSCASTHTSTHGPVQCLQTLYLDSGISFLPVRFNPSHYPKAFCNSSIYCVIFLSQHYKSIYYYNYYTQKDYILTLFKFCFSIETILYMYNMRSCFFLFYYYILDYTLTIFGYLILCYRPYIPHQSILI